MNTDNYSSMYSLVLPILPMELTSPQSSGVAAKPTATLVAAYCDLPAVSAVT